MDRDPGPGARDFTCGSLTYDGHKGTDISVLSLSAMRGGVDVFAAANGTVRGLRDGMPDVLFTDPGAPDITDRDCGNGLVIDHGDGIETQYCHMKQGSLRVQQGQSVVAGDLLGQVGLSGRTEFPHLHLSLRKDGIPADPFYTNKGASCSNDDGQSWWIEPVDYIPGGLIAVGFATGIPEYGAIKAGNAAANTISTGADGLVLWGYVFGARAGDQMLFNFSGPRGLNFSQTVDLTRSQAQLFRATGKRRTLPAWPSGAISGTVAMVRDGVEIDRREVTARIAQ